MAATAAINLLGSISGTATGMRNVGPLTASSAASNGQVQQLALIAGANTITVPSTPAPSGFVFKLPDTNTAVVTLKGVSGDTGIAIGKTGWGVIPFDPAAVPASFVLTSASSPAGITEILFF